MYIYMGILILQFSLLLFSTSSRVSRSRILSYVPKLEVDFKKYFRICPSWKVILITMRQTEQEGVKIKLKQVE